MTASYSEFATKTAADIVIAFLAQGSVSAAELPALVHAVRLALVGPLDPARDPAAAEQFRAVIAQRLGVDPGDDREAAGGEFAVGGFPVVHQPSAQPAVPADQSIHPDYLVSLEDGRHYRSLKRHLMAKYGMTPDDYRRKWNLPADYPMVAPSYAQERSEVAKRIGLGRSPASRPPKRRAARK
jgi:predicted transcriptional regulator